MYSMHMLQINTIEFSQNKFSFLKGGLASLIAFNV